MKKKKKLMKKNIIFQKKQIKFLKQMIYIIQINRKILLIVIVVFRTKLQKNAKEILI